MLNQQDGEGRKLHGGSKQLAVFEFESRGRQITTPYISSNREWRLANIAEYGLDLHHITNNSCLHSFRYSPCAVDIWHDLPCSPNNKWSAIPSNEVNYVNIFRTDDHNIERDLLGLAGRVTSIAFSPDNTKVAAASDAGDIAQWLIESGELLAVWRGHSSGTTVVCHDRTGTRTLSGGADGYIRLCDAFSGKVQAEIRPPKQVPAISLSLNNNGSLILSAASDNQAKLWSSKGELLCRMECPFPRLSRVLLDAMGCYAYLQDDCLGSGLYELDWSWH